jgi:hypothetical protein
VRPALYIGNVGALLVVLVICAACASERQSVLSAQPQPPSPLAASATGTPSTTAPAASSSTSPTPLSDGQCEGTAEALATLYLVQVPTAYVTASPRRDDIAPLYPEIKRHLQAILHRGATPYPASVDENNPEFLAYHNYLQHMRVVEWQGWIDKHQKPYPDLWDKDLYTVNVYHEIPTERVGERWRVSEIRVNHVPLEQIETLEEWLDTQGEGSWHRVSFSGRIGALSIGGSIHIRGGSIAPIK